jgi:heterodisulfide reductase subunit C
MQEMVEVFLLGKKYTVPAELTIMDAMEYAGYKLVRGCGCRSGFCGACAVVYRMKGTTEIKVCLSCQTKIEAGMCVGQIISYPTNKRIFDIEEVKPTANIMGQLYPEIYSCIGCNACTKGCPQGLNVMQYIAYAQRGEYERCAHESFDCVGCNICASRCPAQITHSAVGLLARRLTGKYIAPKCDHLELRVKEIEEGKWNVELKKLMDKPMDEIKDLYNHREIEK